MKPSKRHRVTPDNLFEPRRDLPAHGNGDAGHRATPDTPSGPRSQPQRGREPVPESRRAAADAPATDAWLLRFLKVATVVLLCGWCYAPANNGTWLWDDDQSVTQNPVAKAPFSVMKIWLNPLAEAVQGMARGVLHTVGLGPPPPPPAPVNFGEADYWPLTATGFWLEWHAFGDNPLGYHLVNVALHAVGALLLWRLMVAMRLPGGWFAALLFAVHPLCVETVTWVSELKNVLSLPLMLLALIHFVRADEQRETDALRAGSGDATQDGRRRMDYGLAVFWFVMAMFAKTSMVMLPPVLLLHAWWKRGRIGVTDIIRTAPFFAVSLAFGLLTIYFQHGRAIGTETIPVGGFWSRLATASLALPFYLGKVLMPVNLLPIYPRWAVDPPRPVQFLPLPIMAGIAAWCWMNRATWGRHVLFALGFFALMLLPVLGFITISYMRITWVADHFVYMPMTGPIVLLAAAATGWAAGVPARFRMALVGLAATTVAVLAIGSFRYSFAWADEEPMWTYTLSRNPDAWQAHSRLGARKYSQGKLDEAFFHFSESVRLRPDLAETHNNYGNTLASKGRIDEAIAQFREAARLQPQLAVFQNNLAMTCMQAGRIEDAKEVFRTMLEQWPKDHTLHNNYAFALHRAGDSLGAITSLQRALALAPNYEDAKKNLAVIREELSKQKSAVNPAPSTRLAEAPGSDNPGVSSPTMAPPGLRSPTMAAPALPGAVPSPGLQPQ